MPKLRIMIYDVCKYVHAKLVNYLYYCRYSLSGAKKGKTEVLIDGLPGYPDNIRSNGRGGFYISLLFSRTPEVQICTSLFDSNLLN